MDRSRMVPEPSSLSRPFWEATRNKQLVLQWCDTCDAGIHRPRNRCPRCFGTSLGWRRSAGTGEVYAASVHYKGMPVGPPGRDPYVVALVDLDDGVRIMSNVVGVASEAVQIGQRVAVCWEPLPDGRHLPQFEPIPETPETPDQGDPTNASRLPL